ncbi:MAG: IS630 family transposase [Verrucomicrobia bacterium]|nr:IS630 family transposase [Verrucomicrobiota bacterium]
MKKRGRPRLKLAMSDAQKAVLVQSVKVEKDSVFRDRMRAVLLATDGTRRVVDIAAHVGRAASAVERWLDAFTKGGVDGLRQRRHAPGRQSVMQAPDVQRDLAAGLREGRWRTAPQMAAWLVQTHGISLCKTQSYYWLGKSGGALKMPRPVHTRKDAAAAVAFQEHLFENLVGLNLPVGVPVKVWVQDEARIGLHDPQRRCWALRGVRVVKARQQEYEWCYVCGALEVLSGAAEFRILPTVGLELTHGFLEQIAASDPQAQHVVIWDQAGFHHREGDPRTPPRVHLLALPAYSPELNPVERLWDLLKDTLCNRVYHGIQALEDAACEALQPFLQDAARVRSLVGDGWLRAQANAS